jgi:RNA recognition motif-containing protein
MSKKLYVGNLNYSVTSQELSEFIGEKWTVVDCKVIEGKGFGFVTFEDWKPAAEAKEQLNGQEFKGRPLKIDTAQENNNRRNDRPGGGGDHSRGGNDRYQKRY